MKKNFTRYSVLSFLLLICPVLSAKMYAFVIPNAPSGLVAVAFSPSQINLTWTDNATDETGFELEMSADGKVFVKIAELAKDSVTAQSTGLKASTAYWYRVRSKNLSGNSAYSNIATATTKAPVATIPKAPTSLVAVAFSPTQINLTWTDNATDETGFELEMSTDGKVFVKIAEVAKDSVTARSTGLKASTAYWYRVRAKNLSGNSLYSNIATATTKAPVVTIPKAPSGLTAIAVSGTQINISWVDNAADETGFELERSIDGLTFAKVTDIGPNVEYFQNIGLAPTTKYWYRILAKNTAGKSAYSNLASATTLQVPPVAPDGLTAEAVSSTQINLSWKDKSSNETRFELERSLNATVFTKISDIPLDMTSYQNTGLTPVTAYYYRIRAVNSAGASPYSNVVSATTQNIPVPDMPQNLTAVPTAPDLIQLRWAALTGNASDVVIERSRDPENDFVHLAKLPANILQYEDRDELEIADYYYRIRAVNAGGSSPYSLVAIVPARTIVTGNEPVAVENVIYIENSILNIELKRSSQARLAVFDVGGRLHKNLAIRQVSQTDLRTFTPGVYLVVVETDREMIRRKILVY